jgi:transposase
MEILGRERRRRWSDAQKLDILIAASENGETLSRIARRYDLSRSQIYNWRHEFKMRGQLPEPSDPTFLPVDFAPSMPSGAAAFEEGVISPSIVELCLGQGRRLRFDCRIEDKILMRLIRSVEGA